MLAPAPRPVVVARPAAGPTAPCAAGRRLRRAAATRAAAKTKEQSYVSPSSRTSSTELERLEALSTVVPDVLLSQSLQQVEEPKAATTSRSVLAGIMGNPVSMRRYKVSRVRRLGCTLHHPFGPNVLFP